MSKPLGSIKHAYKRSISLGFWRTSWRTSIWASPTRAWSKRSRRRSWSRKASSRQWSVLFSLRSLSYHRATWNPSLSQACICFLRREYNFTAYPQTSKPSTAKCTWTHSTTTKSRQFFALASCQRQWSSSIKTLKMTCPTPMQMTQPLATTKPRSSTTRPVRQLSCPTFLSSFCQTAYWSSSKTNASRWAVVSSTAWRYSLLASAIVGDTVEAVVWGMVIMGVWRTQRSYRGYHWEHCMLKQEATTMLSLCKLSKREKYTLGVEAMLDSWDWNKKRWPGIRWALFRWAHRRSSSASRRISKHLAAIQITISKLILLL